MLVFATCVGNPETYRRSALAGLRRVAEPDSLLIEATADEGSIFVAYNEVLEHAAALDGLEALVLLHEDVELLDPAFGATVRARLADPRVAVVGAIGARAPSSLAWWEANGAGRVTESRGVIDFGATPSAVDTLDGLLLILSPWAVRNLRFDAKTFHGFHGYDADLCAQARAAGREVWVEDLPLMHHTKGGYGDRAAYLAADATWCAKWGHPAPAAAPVCACALCGAELVRPAGSAPTVVACPSCGVGVTLPPPSREIESDGIWVEQYGGGRLAMRPQWVREATIRLDWVRRHVAGGTLVDVGCATGELPAVAAQSGFTGVGVEPSVWAAERARELGATEVWGDLTEWAAAQPGARADAVTLFHVLEHVHDPREILAEIRRVLDPDGVLFIEVPNFACSDADRDPVAWTGTALTDHVLHYTPDTLRRLLSEAGFEVLEVTPLPTMIYDTPDVWQAHCRTWAALGEVRPSENLLRACARPLAPALSAAALGRALEHEAGRGEDARPARPRPWPRVAAEVEHDVRRPARSRPRCLEASRPRPTVST